MSRSAAAPSTTVAATTGRTAVSSSSAVTTEPPSARGTTEPPSGTASARITVMLSIPPAARAASTRSVTATSRSG